MFSSPEAKKDAWSALPASGTEVAESEFAVGARKERVDEAEVVADDAGEEEEENEANGVALVLEAAADKSANAASAWLAFVGSSR